jgi:signal transduction histidine kinase
VARITAGHATEVQATGLEHGRRRSDLNVVAMQGSSDSRMTGMVASFTDVTRNHELARLRDDLLSSISHELRTPLTNLCSSSEILAQLDPAHEPDWRDFVHILHTESHRLKGLVDDVMSYRQAENSRRDWHIEPHDAERLARNAVKLTTSMVKKAAVRLDLQIDSSAAVSCDGPRILEVLVRLVDNACKFGRRGGHLRLHVAALDDRVEFAVADDGPGIELADRQRVFDRFVQVGDLLTNKPKGAGLGLSICQRIVDAMGGTIWCEDSPLGGIQVRFMLPLARGAAQGETEQGEKEARR